MDSLKFRTIKKIFDICISIKIIITHFLYYIKVKWLSLVMRYITIFKYVKYISDNYPAITTAIDEINNTKIQLKDYLHIISCLNNNKEINNQIILFMQHFLKYDIHTKEIYINIDDLKQFFEKTMLLTYHIISGINIYDKEILINIEKRTVIIKKELSNKTKKIEKRKKRAEKLSHLLESISDDSSELNEVSHVLKSLSDSLPQFNKIIDNVEIIRKNNIINEINISFGKIIL